ncbi:MAG: hypothetical protein ACXWQZ_10875 [Ktedonobacterales bacterium]
MSARPRDLRKGADPAMYTTPTPMPTPTPTLTSAVTVPVAILKALSRAIVEWTASVYPGKSAHLEAASRDPAARRPNTWHATARLSNGVRLRFTLVVHDDGDAVVTRHARLAGGDADAAVPTTTMRGEGRPPHGGARRSRGSGRPEAGGGQ